MNTAIDYRELLREYMRLMRLEHGRNTIRWTRQARPMSGLTDKELKALDEIEQEVDSE
jgi:hypothetical protein